MRVKVIYGTYVGGQWRVDDSLVCEDVESLHAQDGVLKLFSNVPDNVLPEFDLANIFSVEFPV